MLMVCRLSFVVCRLSFLIKSDDGQYSAVTKRFLFFLLATSAFVPLVLLLDGRVPQFVLATAAALFLAYFATDARQTLVAIAIATTGEIILSLGWGLYTYRHALIPLYVPVGHGVFYALAAETAQQAVLRRHARAITRTILVAGTAIAIATLVMYRDQWGLLWWLAAATILTRSKNQLLLSACFTYTMLLEFLGTWIGNWRWAPVVPFVGLQAANPPSGVGILYIVLDVVTVAICSRLILAVSEPVHHVGERGPRDPLAGVALAPVPEQ
jgi:hypothetical protein